MTENRNIDLTLNIKEFEALKKEAQKRFNDNYSSEEPDKHYEWEELELDYLEESIEGNQIKISGNMKQGDKELGWITIYVPLDLEKLTEIFQSYIKKLNKVKTVMESVKDE